MSLSLNRKTKATPLNTSISANLLGWGKEGKPAKTNKDKTIWKEL